MWASGYQSGALKGHVYDDAVLALRAWHAAGLPIHIFSSGSIAAQRLIFGHTAHGDLTPLLAGHFDTTTGPKLEASSYHAIARAIGLPPEAILFLCSDAASAITGVTLPVDCGWLAASAYGAYAAVP